MVLMMKSFNTFGVHWKIQLLGRGDLEKPIYKGDCPKRGAWTVCWFKGAWQERGGWCFWGGVDTPMPTMSYYIDSADWQKMEKQQ